MTVGELGSRMSGKELRNWMLLYKVKAMEAEMRKNRKK